MTATVDGVRIVGRAWVRFTGLWVLVMLAGATFTSFVGTFADDVLRSQADTLFDNGALTPGGTLIIFLELGLPVLLVVLLLMSLGAGAGTRMADDLLGERGARVWASLRRGLPRTVTILLTALAHGLTVLVAVLATPLLVPVGIVGLVIVPLLRRLFRSVAWPDTRFLLVMAIPFAGAVIVAVRWAVAIPAAALEGLSVRAALRRSWNLTGGHEPAAGLALLGGIGLQVVLLVVVDLVRDSSLPELLQSVVALVGPMLALSLPIAVLTVLFRRLAPDANAPADGDGPPRSSTPGWLARFSRPPATAVLVVVAGFLAGTVTVVPTPAEAVVADITVNDLGDAADVTNTDACTNATAGCTLRAALAVAAPGQVIGFAVSGMLRPATPLVLDTADVTIDAEGHRVEVNGDGCINDGCDTPDHAVTVGAAATGFTLRNLTLTTSDWQAPGAALTSSAAGTIEQVSFTAAGGGALDVVAGHVEIVNTTFHNNVWDLRVSATGSAAIAFSTFGDAASTAIESAGGSTTVSASIIAPQSGVTGCVGTTPGTQPNVDTDGTCGGTPVGTLGTYGDHNGWVDTVAIDPGSLAVDKVAQADCPATDARGVARSETTCDLGAFEYLGATSLDLVVTTAGDGGDADPDDLACATAGGDCTLRAAIEQANAKDFLPTSITFTSDLAITVGSPLAITRDLTISGTGNAVSVSGGGATSLLVVDPGVAVEVTDLHLTDGTETDPAGGGAIRTTGELTLTNVSISGSTATAGGGHAIAVLAGGALTMVNGTLEANEGGSGHAITVAAGATADILHTTIRGADGALFADAAATVTVGSSVVDGSSPACAGTIGGSDNQASDASCPGTVSADLGLGTFGMHGGSVPTTALTFTSPAIDAAPALDCPTHDARGVARPQLAACDAGSYEIEPVDGGTVDFLVTDLGDAPDEDPNDGECDTTPADGVCTLRAALEQANATTAANPVDAPTFTVTFASPGIIGLGSSLPLSAAVTIDGGTAGVTLDGGSLHEVLVVAPSPRAWEVRNLTIADGQSSRGGAGVRSFAPGTITNVTFEGNTTLAGAADGGGAIAALGASLDVVNATFSGNGDAALGGSDIRATVPVSVTNSTFVDSANRRIFGTVDVANSLILWTRDGACGGDVTGHHNVQPDGSCGDGPGIVIDATLTLGTYGDHGGPVHTQGLLPASEAVRAADPAACPATDARGHARDATCDVGASEYVFAGSLDVSLPASSAHGVSFDIDVSHVPTFDEGHGTGTISLTSDLDGPIITDQALVDGATTLNASGLSEGDHALTIDYSGDANFPATPANVDHTVRPAAEQDLTIDPTSAVYGEEVTLTSTISDPAASGDVTFTSSLGRVETAPLVAGVATLVLDDLMVGAHEFVASHVGAPTLPDTTSDPVTVTISAAPTTLVLSGPTDSQFGEEVTFVAQVTADAPSTATPTGDVTFFDGGTAIGPAVPLVAGEAQVATSALPLGVRSISAVFNPTPDFAGSNDGLTHTVSTTATTTTVVGPGTTTALGDVATFEVTVDRTGSTGLVPTGDVVLHVDDVEHSTLTLDGAGQATFAISDLTVGTHTLRADYDPDDGFGTSDDSVDHTVVLRPTTTTLRGGSSGVVQTGQDLTIIVTVEDDGSAAVPVGDVELTFGGVALGTGTLSGGEVTFAVEVPPLAPPGGSSALIVATYLGNATHAGSADDHSQLIAPTSVITTLSADPSPARLGDSVDITVELAPTLVGSHRPSGDVVIRNSAGAVVVRGAVTGTRTWTVTAGFGGLPVGGTTLTATYTPDPGWTSVQDANLWLFVDRAVATLDLTVSPAEPERGIEAIASLAIDGDVGQPTDGMVTFYVDGVQIGDPVDTHQASAGVRFDVGDQGTRGLLAQFTGSTDQYQPADARLNLAVQGTPTDTQVHWDSFNDTWEVNVVNASQVVGDYLDAVPSGIATMLVDGVQVASARLVSQAPVPMGSTTFDYQLLPGLHEVTIEFDPDHGFASSQDTQFYDLNLLNGAFAVDSPTSVPWGDIEVGGELQPPNTDDPAPAGVITYALAGSSCTAPAAGGTCTVQVDQPGTYELVVSYPGDDHYVPGSTSRTIEVTRQQADATLDVTGPLFVTGEPLTVSWDVAGPAAGPITVETQRRIGGPTFFGWENACTGGLDDDCLITLPYLSCELCEDWVRVTFPGDALYEPFDVAQELDLATCFPVNLVAEPASGARLRANRSPNCNGGSGYLDGTVLALTATAPPGVPDQWDMYWDDEFYGYYDGFEATPRPREFVVGWNSRDWTPTAAGLTTTVRYEVGLCAPVVIEALSYKGRVLPSLDLEPNCPVNARTSNLPRGWDNRTEYLVDGERTPFPRIEDLNTARQPSITMTTAYFALGTTLPRPTFNTGLLPREDAIRYGYSVGGQPVDALTTTDRRVTVDGVTIRATYGPHCRLVDLDPGAGASWSVVTPTICENPWSGPDAGWLEGEDVTIEIVPPGTSYMVNATFDRLSPTFGAATSDTWASRVQCIGCLDGFDLLHYRRDLTVGPGGVLTSGFSAEIPPVPRWAQCHELVIDPQGESETDIIRFGVGASQGSCPNRIDDDWHHEGRTLSFKVEAEPGFRFGKWNHEEFDALPIEAWVWLHPDSPILDVVMDEDVTLRPSFFRPGMDCHEIQVTARPTAGQERVGTVVTRLTVEAQAEAGTLCPPGNVLDGPSDELRGWLPPGRMQLTTDMAGSRARSGWDFGIAAFPTPDEPGTSTTHEVWLGSTATVTNDDGTAALELDTSVANVTFALCSEIVPVFVVELADGQKTLGVDQDGEFLELSSPNCPFDDTAWQVGSRVTLRNVADRSTYEKIALDGFQGVQAFDFTVDGAAETGFKFADYRLICHTLTLGGESGEIHDLPAMFAEFAAQNGDPTWWSQVETTPLGNCPTTDPRERRYVAGTAVYLEGNVPDGHVRLGWEGSDVELLDDGDTMANAPVVRVTMDRDRFAQFDYRQMSDGERLEDFAESTARDITTAVGNLVKKAAGGLAFGMTQYLLGQPPMSYMTQPGDLFEAMGGLFSASAWVSTSVLDLLDIPHDPIGPPFCPDGVEIGSDECSWFPREIDVTLAALDSLVDMAVSGSRCTAVWGLSGNGSYAGEAVSMFEEVVDLATSVKDGIASTQDAAAQIQQFRQRQEQYLAMVTAAQAAYDAYGLATDVEGAVDPGDEDSIIANFEEVMGGIQLDNYESLADPSALVRCLEEQVEATTDALAQLGL